jgi:hypothetical protein
MGRGIFGCLSSLLKGEQVPKYYFTTPTVSEGPAAEQSRLFSFFRLSRGVSVMKVDGVWYELRFPSSEEVAASEKFYLGGTRQEVTAAEKADLESAGYTVETVS